MAEIFEYIGYVFFAFMFTVGVFSCMRFIVWVITRPLKNSRTVIKLYLNEKSEDTEFALRAAVNRIKWLQGDVQNVSILCVDRGMSEESRKICRLFAEKFPIISFQE